MPSKRVYSPYTHEAALLLGKLIQLGRKEKKMTTKDLADRAGIARGTLQKIEQGKLTSEIGLVFEVATLAGIKLFETNTPITQQLENITNKVALLPQSIRQNKKEVDDDF